MQATQQIKYNALARCKPLLGTYVTVKIVGNKVNDKILITASDKIFSEISRISDLLSFHLATSELSYINKYAHKKSCIISIDMQYILEHALNLSKLSNGAYDVTIAPFLCQAGLLPNYYPEITNYTANWQDVNLDGNKLSFARPLAIDLGGVAKGYAVDRGFLIVEQLINDYNLQIIINAGGDMRMNKWQDEDVSIRLPKLDNGYVFTLPMQDYALATSANYYLEGQQENSTIISTSEKKFIDSKYSVSVFAKNCMIADSLTKIVFLQKDSAKILVNYGAKKLILNSQGAIIDNI
jgi:thiamine biosynthesis lipoprotein